MRPVQQRQIQFAFKAISGQRVFGFALDKSDVFSSKIALLPQRCDGAIRPFDRKGDVVARFAPDIAPTDPLVIGAIEANLSKSA